MMVQLMKANNWCSLAVALTTSLETMHLSTATTTTKSHNKRGSIREAALSNIIISLQLLSPIAN